MNNFVEIKNLDNDFKLDIRYATNNNFLGYAVYKVAKAYLVREAALALASAHDEIKKHGYGFLIFDCYRPFFITELFWEKTSLEKRKFVADPKYGSVHNRGCAVDLSLYDLKSKKEIKMQSEYDDFSERAYISYSQITNFQKDLRDLLISTMKKNDFTVNQYEWWHFDYKDYKSYEILNVPLEEIEVTSF